MSHGPWVETGSNWFCEAVWDGRFEDAGFDRTDVVFGSGARRRPEGLVFVAPGSTVDRLHSATRGDTVLVSNSLPCLLTGLNESLQLAYPDYMYDLRSIIRGVGEYRDELPAEKGPVRLLYFNNLLWDGRTAIDVPKIRPQRELSSYEGYQRVLHSALSALSENMASPSRSRRFRFLGTLSTGYDSPAVAALGLRHGLREAITFTESRPTVLDPSSGASDDGTAIGKILDIEVQRIDRDAWRRDPNCAVQFLAADGNGQEVIFGGAREVLEGRLLLTGMTGDVVWGVHGELGDGFLWRRDQSGLSLAEYRLQVGFLHCPLPQLAAGQVREIRAISMSDAMRPWSVPRYYDRPIPRRILEELGVPRDAFGVHKKAASVRFSDRTVFWATEWHRDFGDWIRKHRGAWFRRLRFPPDLVSLGARPLQKLILKAARRAHGRARSQTARRAIRALILLGSRELLYKYVFPWAVETTKSAYAGAGPVIERPGSTSTIPAAQSVQGEDPSLRSRTV